MPMIQRLERRNEDIRKQQQPDRLVPAREGWTGLVAVAETENRCRGDEEEELSED